MDKESIRINVLDYRETLSGRTFVRRDISVEYEFAGKTGKVIAILGPRRSGKSTLLLQLAEEHEVAAHSRIHIDFSEIAWTFFNASDPDQWRALYEVAIELSEEPVFLLDEIQELSSWASGVLFLLNRGCRVIVTGSNRAVFNEGLTTSLRGKVLVSSLQPLSFREYLRFNEVSLPETLTSKNTARRRTFLLDYLRWGGFPEVVLASRVELKRSLLESYLDVMILRDVIERHRIQNVHVLQQIVTRVLMSFTKDISINRWYNELKSRGFRVGKDTLYEYVDHLQEAQFLVLLANVEAPHGARKAYLIDNGYYGRVQTNPDTGKLLENRVCLDLVTDPTLKFYRDERGEIDFVTQHQLIQSCAELSPSNQEREWTPLRALSQRFPDRSAGVITIDSYPHPIPMEA